MLAIVALLAAATPSPSEHLKVLVLDVVSTDLNDSERTTLANLEAAHLGEEPLLEVLSSSDVKQLVALQGQAAEVGVNGKCTDACMAELAGALGAGVVVSTQAGKLGDTLVVTLAVFDAAKAKSVSRKSVTASSLGELPEKIAVALDALVKPLLPEGTVHIRSDTTSPTPAPPPTAAPARVEPPAPAPAPVQTRVVARAPPPAPAPAPTPAPDASSSSDDDALFIVLGVGAAVAIVVVVVLLVSDPNSGASF